MDTLSGTASYVTGTTYDAGGRVTSRALGNGLTQGFNYYAWNEKATADSVLTGQGGRLKILSAVTIFGTSYLLSAMFINNNSTQGGIDMGQFRGSHV